MSKGHLITTIKEKCRVCYTCVRECPAKAIRIYNGQAEIIPERCIACGHCVIVCSQKAKQQRSSCQYVLELLQSEQKVVACVAPSFPAEFETEEELVGKLKALGFANVFEVAFGADIVALQYKKLLDSDPHQRFITTACPAVVAYVEKYHPSLVKNLAPIVSPMVATARILRQHYGEDIKVVFIGPCIAKKFEADRPEMEREIDAVLTFYELKEMLSSVKEYQPVKFDPPYANRGHIFPMGRGLLQTAGIKEDLMNSDVISVEGTKHFISVLKEFEAGNLEDVRLLDILCCDGCIMGPGMTTKSTQHARQILISRYASQRNGNFDEKQWREEVSHCDYLNMSSTFTINDMRLPMPSREELQSIFSRLGKCKPEDELNCGACGYETCLEHAVAIHKGLAESEMCLPYTIEKLKETVNELSESYEQLADTKQALIQNEKLASMGQLAAGIAHEVNNPLGVVLLYSHLLQDQCPKDSQMYQDLQMVVEQADRCKKIVGGLLNFARKNRVILLPINVNKLAARTIKALIIPGNIQIEQIFHQQDIIAEIDSDQMVQVLSNLLTNAIEAMPAGGRIRVELDSDESNLKITVGDNGPGIPPEIKSRIFEPFFTTKQIGKGTGLGLPVSYGIIKMHRGQILVESNTEGENRGTTFHITVPLKGAEKVYQQGIGF